MDVEKSSLLLFSIEGCSRFTTAGYAIAFCFALLVTMKIIPSPVNAFNSAPINPWIDGSKKISLSTLENHKGFPYGDLPFGGLLVVIRPKAGKEEP